jgi:YbbR domain-containing protein
LVETSNIVVTDVTGKVVINSTVLAGNSSTQLNVSELANGNYTISVETEGASKQAVKFTKQ